MKAVIVEDEKQAIKALERDIIENCPDVEVAGSASTVYSAIELINKVQPEIVFLDIQLKDGTGFNVLEAIGNYEFKVIFTTAYSEYALQAIRISALDYLLKPIDSEHLVQAVNKAKKTDLSGMKAQIESLLENQSNNPLQKKIALPTSKGISLFEFSEIVRIQSDGNYSAIYLSKGRKIIVAKTLREFEELLKNQGFIRIHHSHLINLNHLESYISKDGGYVVLNTKESLPVSKRKKVDLLRVLNMT